MEEEEKLVACVRNNRSYRKLQKDRKKDKKERLNGLRLLEALKRYYAMFCFLLIGQTLIKPLIKMSFKVRLFKKTIMHVEHLPNNYYTPY